MTTASVRAGVANDQALLHVVNFLNADEYH